MASNRKSSSNVVKGMENIGKLNIQAGAMVVASAKDLPVIPKLGVMNSNAAAEFAKGIENLCKELEQRATALAEVLSDEQVVALQMQEIRHFEDSVCKAIESIKPDVAKQQVAKIFFDTFVVKVAHTQIGLNHVADIGKRLGFLKSSDKEGGLRLPLTIGSEGNKWKWQDFTCSHALIGRKIETIALEVKRDYEVYKASELQKLMEGVGPNSLLEVIEQGDGECVVYCPPDNTRGYPGGNVKVVVKKGNVFPIDSVGSIRGLVRGAAEQRVCIPVASLTDDRLKLGHRVESEKLFLLMVKIHGLLRRGYTKSLVSSENLKTLKEMQAKATIKPEEFLLKEMVGVTHLFFKKWDDLRGDKPVEIKNVNFLVQRNEKGEIKVVESFVHLGDLFANCLEYQAPGEKYAGLSQPLGAMLRNLHGLFAKKAKANEAKANEADKQEETRKWAEGLKANESGQSANK